MAMSDRKMTGKQEVAKGFDLDSFVGAAAQPEPAPSTSRTADPKPPKAAKPKPVKKEKPAKELLSERVQLKVTAAEMAVLKEKAGLVPLSAFLRKHLKDTDLI